jgi:hypothetical protein
LCPANAKDEGVLLEYSLEGAQKQQRSAGRQRSGVNGKSARTGKNCIEIIVTRCPSSRFNLVWSAQPRPNEVVNVTKRWLPVVMRSAPGDALSPALLKLGLALMLPVCTIL